MVQIKGTRTYIDVYIEDRVVRIQGELLVGKFATFRESIQEWTTPAGVKITEEEKQDIIERVTEKTQGSHLVVIFE